MTKTTKQLAAIVTAGSAATLAVLLAPVWLGVAALVVMLVVVIAALLG